MDDNTKTVLLAAIGALGGIVASIMAAWSAYLTHIGNKRVDQVHEKVNTVDKKVEQVGEEVNGRITELVKAEKKASRAEGVEAERKKTESQ